MFSYISYLVFLVKTYITMVTLSQLVNEYYCITTEKNLKFLDHFLTVVVFPLASLNCEFVRLYLFLVTDHHEVRIFCRMSANGNFSVVLLTVKLKLWVLQSFNGWEPGGPKLTIRK